jgi:hypothetical protein
MHAAVEWGMGDIHLETNSRVLVCALQNSDYDPAPKGVLFRDMRIVLRMNFISYQVSHVSKTCNSVAHVLDALGANHHEVWLLWLEDVPDDVNVVVASELVEPN